MEHWQKTFFMLSRFDCSVGGGGGLSDALKKWKFVMKIFFSDNVEWSSKNLWKMISADVIKTTRNKRSGHCIFTNFYKKYLQNLKHNVKNFG